MCTREGYHNDASFVRSEVRLLLGKIDYHLVTAVPAKYRKKTSRAARGIINHILQEGESNQQRFIDLASKVPNTKVLLEALVELDAAYCGKDQAIASTIQQRVQVFQGVVICMETATEFVKSITREYFGVLMQTGMFPWFPTLETTEQQ